ATIATQKPPEAHLPVHPSLHLCDVDGMRLVQGTDLPGAPRRVLPVQRASLRGVESHRNSDEHMAQPALCQPVLVADDPPGVVTFHPGRYRRKRTRVQVDAHPVAEGARTVIHRAVIDGTRCVDPVLRSRRELVALLLARDVLPPRCG